MYTGGKSPQLQGFAEVRRWARGVYRGIQQGFHNPHSNRAYLEIGQVGVEPPMLDSGAFNTMPPATSTQQLAAKQRVSVCRTRDQPIAMERCLFTSTICCRIVVGRTVAAAGHLTGETTSASNMTLSQRMFPIGDCHPSPQHAFAGKKKLLGEIVFHDVFKTVHAPKATSQDCLWVDVVVAGGFATLQKNSRRQVLLGNRITQSVLTKIVTALSDSHDISETSTQPVP